MLTITNYFDNSVARIFFIRNCKILHTFYYDLPPFSTADGATFYSIHLGNTSFTHKTKLRYPCKFCIFSSFSVFFLSRMYRHPHKNVSTFIFRMGFQGLFIRRESVEYILIAQTYRFSKYSFLAFQNYWLKADSMFQGEYVLVRVTVRDIEWSMQNTIHWTHHSLQPINIKLCCFCSKRPNTGNLYSIRMWKKLISAFSPRSECSCY